MHWPAWEGGWLKNLHTPTLATLREPRFEKRWAGDVHAPGNGCCAVVGTGGKVVWGHTRPGCSRYVLAGRGGKMVHGRATQL